MRNKIQFLFWGFIVALMLPLGVLAQQRAITGVVRGENNEPVSGVTVANVTTGDAVVTNAQGVYRINAANGNVIAFTYVGYERSEVTVGSANSYDVNLLTGSAALDDVVVTAEFGMKRIGRAVGSSVQVISGDKISESGRDAFVSSLQGRVPGLTVTSTSGAPGASTTVVLRNITSISGNNQPLYVVDGIPMNNSSFNPIGLAGAETYSVRNSDFASRGNDFNPEDIENITVLKGAAAAALYGSDASNGAIIITTKKGRAGRGRVNYSNSFRWDHAYGYPEMQTKYANGAYGTTNYYYTAKYGGEYPAGMQLYDNIAAVLQTGFTQRHNLSVEAGTDKATIRGGVSYLDQQGVVKTTAYDRLNLSLSGKASITDWLQFEATLQYVNTNNNKVLRGTDGPLYRAMIWPMVDNMANYLAADGMHMRYPEYYSDVDLLNPLFAMNRNRNFDKSDRFISMVAFTVNPFKNSFIRAQFGNDVGMQTYESSWHPYYANRNAGLGRYDLTHSNFQDPTVNILAGYNNKFLEDRFSVSAQVGYHQLQNKLVNQSTSGSRFIIPDFQSINNTDPATVSSRQRNTVRRIQAVSGQLELGYNNMAFLTFRARNDWSSTLPIDNNSYFYPAVEASFILTELEGLKNSETVSFVKLRGSLAQVGKDAGPLEIDPQLEPTNQTGGGFRYGFTGPNPNLRPEMTTAREIGFDARFFNNRVNTIFSYYTTKHSDQIVKGFRLSYATGFVLNTLNVGTFETQGWEGLIDVDVIRNPRGLTWNIGVNGSQARSKVVYLPENVSEYYNAYTWNSGNIRNGIMVGHPITTLTGRAYERNENGDLLISPTTGLPIVASNWSVLGDREPKLRFGITSALSYKGLRLSALFAGRYKATVVNGTKRLMLSQGTSWESVNLRESEPVVFKGVLRDGNENSRNPTINNIAVNYRTGVYAGNDEDWLEKDVNYLRLQELRLSYNVPTDFLSPTKIISGLNVFVVGNDLFTWTNYSGIDAVGNTVSAAAGGTGGEGYDVFSLPNPRGITVGVSLNLN